MMNSSKRYFWLKMNSDFFERDWVQLIESEVNGKEYLILYLKLLLKTLNTNGALVFQEKIPYSIEMISRITRTNCDTVRVAIDVFQNLNLLEVNQSGAYVFVELPTMVGSESHHAIEKRKQRQKLRIENSGKKCQKLTMSGQCPTEKELEIDPDKKLLPLITAWGEEEEEIWKWLTELLQFVDQDSLRTLVFKHGKQSILSIYDDFLTDKRSSNITLGAFHSRLLKLDKVSVATSPPPQCTYSPVQSRTMPSEDEIQKVKKEAARIAETLK